MAGNAVHHRKTVHTGAADNKEVHPLDGVHDWKSMGDWNLYLDDPRQFDHLSLYQKHHFKTPSKVKFENGSTHEVELLFFVELTDKKGYTVMCVNHFDTIALDTIPKLVESKEIQHGINAAILNEIYVKIPGWTDARAWVSATEQLPHNDLKMEDGRQRYIYHSEPIKPIIPMSTQGQVRGLKILPFLLRSTRICTHW